MKQKIALGVITLIFAASLVSMGCTVKVDPFEQETLSEQLLSSMEKPEITDSAAPPPTEDTSSKPSSTKPDTIQPKVSKTSPEKNQSDVPVNNSIVITFSESMKASTINSDTVKLIPNIPGGSDSGIVEGKVSYSYKKAIFKPETDLSPDTSYKISVSKNVTDVAGNKMTSDFSSEFKTGNLKDVTPPVIKSHYPPDNEYNIDPTVNIELTFSKEMDHNTINLNTFSLYSLTDHGEIPVNGGVIYENGIAIFNPANDLDLNLTYRVQITGEMKDINGLKIDPQSFTFTTRGESDDKNPGYINNTPTHGEQNVPLNTNIQVHFSEEIKSVEGKEAISLKKVTIAEGGEESETDVAGSIIINSNILKFTPQEALQPSTTYSYTVFKDNISDLNGNPPQTDWTVRFATTQPAP